MTRKQRDVFNKNGKVLLKQLSKLEIENGVLIRRTNRFKQIVVPSKYHNVVYTELHIKLAHLGSERVLELARSRFYWPGMKFDIEQFIRKKCRCQISKEPNVKDRAPLVSIESHAPFEFVSLDFMHLD